MGLPGNIVRITDGAQQSLFYDDAFVAPANQYTYDAVYRLIAATGREHASNGDVQVDDNDQPIRNLPLATSPTAVRNYEETYQYDAVGNVLEMFHDAGSGAATGRRFYDYGPDTITSGVPDTNRLRSTSLTGDTEGDVPYSAQYGYADGHGSMTSMPHLAAIDYTPFDQMRHADLGGGGDSYYAYDSGGTRIRKVIDTGINLIKERIYLGSFEIYREIVSSTVDKERQTLHVLDGVKRIAMVETLTIDDGDLVSTPDPKQRYQLGNHLGSALLELDESGLIVSYEEYHAYGTSAYRSARSGVEVSARRYRYIGMERDDETGLYLMGARYYAGWLGRWTSADPMGIGADGPGLYNYTRGSPVTLSDPSGHEPAGYDPSDLDSELSPKDQVAAGLAVGLLNFLVNAANELTGGGGPAQIDQQVALRQIWSSDEDSSDKARDTANLNNPFYAGPLIRANEAAERGDFFAVGESYADTGVAAANVAGILSFVRLPTEPTTFSFRFPKVDIDGPPGGLSFAGGGEFGLSRPLTWGETTVVFPGAGSEPGGYFGGTFSFTFGGGKKPPFKEPEPDEDVRTIEDRGAVWTERGGLDFANSEDLFPVAEGQKNVVTIEYTGDYLADFAEANRRAGFGNRTTPPKGYTWHHLDDYDPVTNTGTVQLVSVEAHSVSHFGGAAQYKAATGRAYTFGPHSR